jgi:hypothetical protein
MVLPPWRIRPEKTLIKNARAIPWIYAEMLVKLIVLVRDEGMDEVFRYFRKRHHLALLTEELGHQHAVLVKNFRRTLGSKFAMARTLKKSTTRMMVKAHSTPAAIPTTTARGLRNRDMKSPARSAIHRTIPGSRDDPPPPESGVLILGEYPPNRRTIT